MPDFSPNQFGRYRLLERIGVGGMASVYRAALTGPGGFQRTVVVKRVLPQFLGDREFVQSLVSEALLCSKLMHPSIVQVLELGYVDEVPYLAMEHIDGFDLARVLQALSRDKQTMPLGLIAYIIRSVAAALAYAHSASDDHGQKLGIVHRDVSPSNVMLARAGGIKLVDFGIAKALLKISDEKTRTGSLKGKVSYMSPEQANGEELDGRSDQFSLGIMFWEMLTMRRLFRADHDLKTLALVREGEVVPPSQLVPSIPPEVDAIVLRLLARSRDDRFPSCRDVAEALAPIVHAERGDSERLADYLKTVASLSTMEEKTPAHISPRRAPPVAPPAVAKVDAVDAEVFPALVSAPAPESRRWVYAVGGLVLGVVLSGGALLWQFAGRASVAASEKASPPTANAPATVVPAAPVVSPPSPATVESPPAPSAQRPAESPAAPSSRSSKRAASSKSSHRSTPRSPGAHAPDDELVPF